ncbi:MAG TPA: NADPH:quinone oxidoreductase family protein [Candidatus Limnocylindrales bacterium]|nr:NADPH:quinone oxidoreductase family protein [Candidatus Limnocylindrales bacterium]
MRAVVCKEFGPPESLVIEELPSPPLAAGQVRLDVHACGVNFPDTLIIDNKYQFKPPLPFSPGGEVAGVISEVGRDVEGWAVGDRVVAMSGWGGFVEEMVIDPSRLMRVPDGMDMATAAGFTMTYGTSHYALKDRAAIRPGETLLVLGAAGGVGLAAVELGKVMGARVIAAAGSDEKLEVCRSYGADEVIHYGRENLKERAKELTGGAGADVIYDPVGGDAFDEAIRCIGWEGRYLVIGFASGRIPQLPVNLVLLKSCQVVGVFWGAFTARDPERNSAHLAELASWFAQGRLRPLVSSKYPLEQASVALRAMLDRKVTGKVVLTTERAGA